MHSVNGKCFISKIEIVEKPMVFEGFGKKRKQLGEKTIRETIRRENN